MQNLYKYQYTNKSIYLIILDFDLIFESLTAILFNSVNIKSFK